MNVILVEDSDADALLFTDILESSGHSVERYGNGALFLDDIAEKFKSKQSDTILILDLVMPEMDGLEIVGEMGDRGVQIPTILVSAREVEFLKIFRRLAEANKIPIVADLRKPVGREILLNAIHTHELNQKLPPS